MPIAVHKVILESVSDASGLERLIESGELTPVTSGDWELTGIESSTSSGRTSCGPRRGR